MILMNAQTYKLIGLDWIGLDWTGLDGMEISECLSATEYSGMEIIARSLC